MYPKITKNNYFVSKYCQIQPQHKILILEHILVLLLKFDQKEVKDNELKRISIIIITLVIIIIVIVNHTVTK